jgi:hypothetical protein
MGEGARIAGIFWSPVKAFQDIVRKPTFMVPLLVLILFQLVVTAVIYKPVIIPSQIAKMSENPNMNPAQLAAVEKSMSGPFGWCIAFGGMLVALPLILVLWAALFYFVFSLLLSGRADFRSVFAVTTYASLIGIVSALVRVPLMFARQDLEVTLSPAALLDRPVPPTFLYSFLQGLDVFSIWSWLVVGFGLSILYRKPQGQVVTWVMGLFLAVIVVTALAKSMFHPGS